jgi:hypothetical protein
MAGIIISLKDGHVGFYKPRRPDSKGWLIDDMARILTWLVRNYSRVDKRKPEFTRSEIVSILQRLLFKPRISRARSSGSKNSALEGLTLRQQRFVMHYIGAALGNRAKAARLAGYSPKRAKQTGYDLMHQDSRRRF